MMLFPGQHTRSLNLKAGAELAFRSAAYAYAVFARLDDPAAFTAPKFQMLPFDSKRDAVAFAWGKRDACATGKPMHRTGDSGNGV